MSEELIFALEELLNYNIKMMAFPFDEAMIRKSMNYDLYRTYAGLYTQTRLKAEAALKRAKRDHVVRLIRENPDGTTEEIEMTRKKYEELRALSFLVERGEKDESI